MDFDWTDPEQQLRDAVAAALDASARADAAALEDADLPRLEALTRGLLGRLAAAGYLALDGGPGGGSSAMRLLAGQEEVARLSASLFLAAETSARLFGGLLVGCGRGEEVRQILAAVREGRAIGAVALGDGPEGSAGSPALARREQRGFALSGAKPYVTNGPLADTIAVAARSEEGTVIALLARGAPGLVVGPRLATLGHAGLAVSSIRLEEARVAAELVLGPFADHTPLERLAAEEDLALALASVGVMERALAAAKSHAAEHRREGKPINRHQEVSFKLAEMLATLQTAQLLVRRAAWLRSVADAEAPTVVRCAKVFAAEAAERVAGSALQILAGAGYLRGNPAEQGYREAKLAALAGTTSERCRMEIAAELLARNPV